MIICHSRRFVLFCNPGTGTGPLLRVLASFAEEPVVDFCDRSARRPFYHLMPPAEVAAAFADRSLDFAAYRRVTLVRDPFARLQALYRRIADSDPAWAALRQTAAGQPGFCAWVRAIRPDGTGAGQPRHPAWRRYGSWSAAAWCGNHVTDAIPSERLTSELPPLFRALGISPGPIPRPLPEPGRAWATTYDGPTVHLVARRYAADLARFGWHHPALDWVA